MLDYSNYHDIIWGQFTFTMTTVNQRYALNGQKLLFLLFWAHLLPPKTVLATHIVSITWHTYVSYFFIQVPCEFLC